MPIDPAAVSWDEPSVAPEGGNVSPDPSKVAWDPAPIQPGSPTAAAMSHSPQDHHQALAAMLYPEIDFDTGLPFLDRTHLAQADNFEEKKAYLEKVYGKKSVEIDSDPYGNPMLVVNKDGKKIAAEGGSGFGQFTADVVGSGPEWTAMGAGAAEGAGIGAFAGPLGAGAGAIGGAAIGGMFGKTVIEGEKAAQGIYRKTPSQYTGAVGQAGEEGALGELGGKLTAGMISKILRGAPPAFITGVTPESRAMTERLLGPDTATVSQRALRSEDARRAGLGYGPGETHEPVRAQPQTEYPLPNMKSLQFRQVRAEKLLGAVKNQQEANTAYVENRVRKMLLREGVGSDEIDAVLKDLHAGERVTTEQVGEHVKSRVRAHREMLEKNVQDRLTAVNADVDRQLTHLDTLTRRFQPGDLGVDVGRGIQQARSDFGTAMSKVYEKVDSLVGDRPLVDTSLPAKEAARLGKQLPRTGQPALQRETASLAPQQASQDDLRLYESFGLDPPPSGKVSFGDAQRFRTALREKSDELSLTRDSRAAAAARLADMWDYAIQGAAKDPAAAPAVKLLNAADKAYAQGIKRFNDSTVKRLVKNLEAGLPPDPEEIARQIVQPGQEARVREIRKMVGEDVWKRVAGADYARMIRASTDETGQLDGTRLLAEIRERRQLMGVVYGDNLSQQIEDLARTVAVRDGKLSLEALAPGRIRTTLENLRGAQDSEERFVRENFLGLLGNPRRNPEQVYRWLVKPDNAAALRESVSLFGENSPEIKGLRQTALQELLVQAKFSAADTRSPDAILQSLGRYTKEQRQILFPHGLDSDIELLGKEVQALMLDLKDESMAGMSAGAIHSKPLFGKSGAKGEAKNGRIWTLAYNAGLQWVLSKPTFIRYMALGLRQPPGPARQATRSMLENLFRFGSIEPTLDSNEGAPPNGQEGDTALAGAAPGP